MICVRTASKSLVTGLVLVTNCTLPCVRAGVLCRAACTPHSPPPQAVASHLLPALYTHCMPAALAQAAQQSGMQVGLSGCWLLLL
jgi:hypothetical protein